MQKGKVKFVMKGRVTEFNESKIVVKIVQGSIIKIQKILGFLNKKIICCRGVPSRPGHFLEFTMVS